MRKPGSISVSDIAEKREFLIVVLVAELNATICDRKGRFVGTPPVGISDQCAFR